MVAYSFQKRFIGPIRRGEKMQTIRAVRQGRVRHAREGELLQLYYGMRTRACQRIIADPCCVGVQPVILIFGHAQRIVTIIVGGSEVVDRDAFAIADGFSGVREMSDFWVAHHGPLACFTGVLIRWTPPTSKEVLP